MSRIQQLALLLLLWDLMIVVAIPAGIFFLFKEWQMLNEIAIAMHLL